MESRCPHGFIRSVVRCPACGGVVPARVPVEQRKGNVEDMAGRTLAGVRVLERAANVAKGNAAWHCQLLDCGHHKTVQGSALRQLEKTGGRVRCPEGCSRGGRKAAVE